jgi:ADP-ribose pyrophosphatase
MQSWKTVSKNIILNHSRFLTVENHTIELPNGQTIADWPWLVTPDYVNVAVITGGGKFICFRQTKYAVDGVSLAPVGGYLEPGEAPLMAARRELLEETGYQADEWFSLGQYPVDGNRGVGVAHLFLARGARRITNPDADDLEEQELLLLSRAKVETALAQGQFKLLPWVAVMALALNFKEE